LARCLRDSHYFFTKESVIAETKGKIGHQYSRKENKKGKRGVTDRGSRVLYYRDFLYYGKEGKGRKESLRTTFPESPTISPRGGREGKGRRKKRILLERLLKEGRISTPISFTSKRKKEEKERKRRPQDHTKTKILLSSLLSRGKKGGEREREGESSTHLSCWGGGGEKKEKERERRKRRNATVSRIVTRILPTCLCRKERKGKKKEKKEEKERSE